MDKLKISLPILVEGKYDRVKLSSIVDGTILSLGGFAVFNRQKTLSFLRRTAERQGVILLTDSDGGGRQIRAFLSECLPPDRVHHVYIPKVAGKEKRKRAPGKAGLLGVEGIEADTLRRLLAPYADGKLPASAGLTKADLYADGFSGGPDSAARRRRLAARLDLPEDLSADALLSALNLLLSAEEYRTLAAALRSEEK